MDGTYSSGSNCNAYYGKDATTGAYVAFSVGQNQSYFLYDQPLDLQHFKDATQIGRASCRDSVCRCVYIYVVAESVQYIKSTAHCHTPRRPYAARRHNTSHREI